MTISKSLPIQWWLTDDETYNETQICGVYNACFCQPFECDDPIVDQFTDVADQIFYLVIYNTDEEEVARVQYEEVSSGVYQLSFIPSELSPSLCEKVRFERVNTTLSIEGTATQAGYIQTATASVDWSLGNDPPHVSMVTGGSGGLSSEKIYKAIAPAQQGDTITLETTVTTSGGGNISQIVCSVLFLDSGLSAISSTVIYNGNVNSVQSGSNDLIVPAGAVYIGVQVNTTFGAGGGNALTALTVFNTTQIIAKSDCIDLRETHPCTEVLVYTGSTNFDGINYTVSPQPTFYLRIPAQFWKENNPMTQEDSELSNGVIVTRRQSIQEKTLLEIGFVTNYLHKKIQKVLMTETVSIRGQTYKRRDEYEAENLNRYPLKRGSVWLTKYDSVEKNTI